MRHQHKKNREHSEAGGERSEPCASHRLLGILKILSQIAAITGTVMAIVDALHRW
jgi:hypothetical protein